MSTSQERMDDNKMDEAVLALLYLGVFERHPMMGARAWKSFDSKAMDRLHRKGLMIMPACSAPAMSRASSVGVGSGGSDAMPCHSAAPRTRPATATPSIPMSAAPRHPARRERRDGAEAEQGQHRPRRRQLADGDQGRLAVLDDAGVAQRDEP